MPHGEPRARILLDGGMEGRMTDGDGAGIGTIYAAHQNTCTAASASGFVKGCSTFAHEENC